MTNSDSQGKDTVSGSIQSPQDSLFPILSTHGNLHGGGPIGQTSVSGIPTDQEVSQQQTDVILEDSTTQDIPSEGSIAPNTMERLARVERELRKLLSISKTSGRSIDPNCGAATTQLPRKLGDPGTPPRRGLSGLMTRESDIGQQEVLRSGNQSGRTKTRSLSGVAPELHSHPSAPMVTVNSRTGSTLPLKRDPETARVYQMTRTIPMLACGRSQCAAAVIPPTSSEDTQGEPEDDSSREEGGDGEVYEDDREEAVESHIPISREQLRIGRSPKMERSGEDRLQSRQGLEDETWLRRLKTAKAFLEEIPTLQPSRWLDWILGIRDLATDLDIQDEQAISVAAIQFKMDQSIRDAIRAKCPNPRPTIVELMQYVRAVCTTPEHMTMAERQLQGIRQGENEPLIEYLRRFEGWCFVAENRTPTPSQHNEWKTKLLAGLNMYSARLVDARLYRMSHYDVLAALFQLSTEDYWDGFTSYRKQPFILVNHPIAHSHHQTRGPIRPGIRYCRKCGHQGHIAEVCDGRARQAGPGLSPRDAEAYNARRNWTPPHQQYTV